MNVSCNARTTRKLMLAGLFALSASPLCAYAGGDLTQIQKLGQSEFNRFANDFISAASYKAITPATPLGITGFDIGAELSITQLGDNAVWKKSGADISSLVMPKLHIHKGLPFNIDLGASLVAVPNSNIKLIGMEARYALLEGSIATPAVAVRGAYTKLSGVSQLDLDTKSIELVVSKGFVMLTPYAGVGRVWGSVTPNVAGLQKVSPTANKLFAGVNANFGLFNVAGEVDRTGSNDTVSVKFGFRW
jgi:hypothetical protein